MKKLCLLGFVGMALSFFSFACNSINSLVAPMAVSNHATATSTPANTATSTPVVLSCATPVTGDCATGQKILLISTGTYAIHYDLVSALTCAGASVTVIDVTTTSYPVYTALTTAGLTLGQFDQVWDCRWPGSAYSAMTGPDTTPNTDQNLYKNYLANHGSLLLLFEYIDAAQFSGMTSFLNNVVSQTPVFTTQLGSTINGWALNVPGAAAAENFGNNCQTLSTAVGAILTTGDGCLPITQCGGTPLYVTSATEMGYAPGQLTLAVAWIGCQMKASVSNGKVVAFGDREFFENQSGVCPGTAENDKVILNLMRLLVKD